MNDTAELKLYLDLYSAITHAIVGTHANNEDIDVAVKNCLRVVRDIQRENEALRKRLEINPVAPEYDGIACRDETIKQLERQVRELKLALESDYR